MLGPCRHYVSSMLALRWYYVGPLRWANGKNDQRRMYMYMGQQRMYMLCQRSCIRWPNVWPT